MDNKTYQAISPDSEDDATSQNRNQLNSPPWWHQSTGRRKLELSCLAFSSLLALTLTVILITNSLTNKNHQTQNQHLQERETCGESAYEARKLGCIFDPILLGWVPWRCHSVSLSSSFMKVKNWEFFQKPHSMEPFPREEFMKGEWDTLFVSHEFYIENCMYAWRKIRDVARNGEILDGYLADDHQTNHCEMMMLRRTDLNDTNTDVYTKFVSCPRAHDNDGRFGWYRMINGKKIYRQP